jgi:signal transduction histidine kinase
MLHLKSLLAEAEGNLKLAKALDDKAEIIECEREAFAALQESQKLIDIVSSISGYHFSHPELLDLNSIVTRGLENISSERLANIDLELSLHSEQVFVYADKAELESIVQNLVENAIEAIPKRGNIRIGTSYQSSEPHPADVVVSFPPSQRSVRLQVIDTGVGMSEDTAERAFDPFFTTKHDEGRLGLGLPQVCSMARRAAGHVELQTKIGQGTTMTVRFPSVEKLGS